MSNALTIDPRDFQGQTPTTSDADTLQELTQHFEQATTKVKQSWEELSEDERADYVDFAYAVVDDSKNRDRSRLRALSSRLIAAWYSFRLTFGGQQEAFAEYVIAFRNFVEAILDAVERESSAYHDSLNEALEEGVSDAVEEAMTLEEARERRKQLRHQIRG